MNTYPAIDLNKDNIISQSTLSYPTRNIEKILLVLIAALGILGSLYIFSASSRASLTPKYTNVAAIPILDDSEESAVKARFKNYVKIEGKKKVREVLQFTFKKDRSETRYVLDMGNGERMIITADNWPYAYSKPGTYKLELKKIERGLITVVASKKIKIK